MRFRNYAIVGLLVVLLAIVYWLQHRASFTYPQPNSGSSLACINPPACTEHEKLQVQFSVFPVEIEEEIYANLAFRKGWELKKAWVEGVNMYMGKTTAIIQDKQTEKGQANVIFFLGSCSEPTMHWRLKTEWINPHKNVNSPNSVFAYFDFYTELN